MTRRFWLAASLVFLIPMEVFASSSALPNPISFHAVIQPPEPLRVQGTVLTAQGPSSVAEVFSASTPAAHDLSSNIEGTITVYERRWQSVSPSDEYDSADALTGLIQSSFDAQVHGLSMRVIGPSPSPTPPGVHWFVGPIANITLEPISACSVHLEPGTETIVAAPGNRIATLRAPVVATCETRLVRAPAGSDLYFYGGQFGIAYLESGTPKSQVMATGPLIAREGQGSTVYQHTNRLLRVHTAASTDVSFDPPLNTTLKSSHLAVAGVLEIPASEGFASWGEWRSGDRVPSLQPSGLLVVSRADGNTTSSGIGAEIRGETVNAYTVSGIPRPPVSGQIVVVSAAAAVGLASLVALQRKVRWLFGTLFTRLTQSKTLDHARRKTLLELVSQNPGAPVQVVGCLAGFTRRITDYHLEVLVRQGLVVKAKIGRSTALFTKEAAPATQDLTAMQLIPNPTARRLLDALRMDPRQSQRRLALTLGVSQPCVSIILKSLVEAGHVEVIRDGRKWVHHVHLGHSTG